MAKKTSARKRSTKRKNGTKRSRKVGGNAELIKQNVENIEQQMAFVKQNSDEFSKIGVNPEEFDAMMQDVLNYIKKNNGEIPPEMQQFGLGSVDILKQQIIQIEDAIQRGGFSF
jgi:hypothetical protein